MRTHIGRLAILALLGVVGTAACRAGERGDERVRRDDPVIVELHDAALVTSGTRVLLGQIATLTNGSPAERAQLERLDVGRRLAPGQRETVDKRDVETRILLAAFAQPVEIRGAGVVVTSHDVELGRDESDLDRHGETRPFRRGTVSTRLGSRSESPSGGSRAAAYEEEFVHAVREEFARRLNVAPGAVSVSLLSQLGAVWEKQIPEGSEVKLRPRLGATPRIGRQPLDYRVEVDGVYLRSASADLNVAVEVRTVVASHSLSSGATLTVDDVAEETVLVERGAVPDLTVNEVVGQTLMRSLVKGEVVPRTALSRRAAAVQSSLIASRDAVHVFFSRGGLTIAVGGFKAMESGRLGDVIAVENVETKKRIAGHVVGPGQVEFRLPY